MPTLTLEAIRENPWNVVDHELPEHPSALLLRFAHFAAYYCRMSEMILMTAARLGFYQPRGWRFRLNDPDVHEESEPRSCDSDRTLEEICELFEAVFGEPM